MIMKTILDNQIEAIMPSNAEITYIQARLGKILAELKTRIKKLKIGADIFVGGSFAKNTLIKKKKYDVDIFVRFDKSYSEEKIAKMIDKIVPKESIKLHGSRDYYVIRDDSIEFEIIPTLSVKNPEQARNVTDLSYFHVNYVNKALRKNKKLSAEIMLAKSFVHASGCYGAESYIQGFSGYALELLVIHYNGFLRFIRAIAESRDKIIIDDMKAYKNILKEMNESKLQSPIILVDPTFKQRNALAALNQETFEKFKKYCRNFLKSPNAKFFEIKAVGAGLEKKYGDKIEKIEIKTDKQSGDIAGTKLKKFYSYFIFELGRYFSIEKSDFEYFEDENKGVIYLVVQPKKLIEFCGPPIEMKEALSRFKKEHKKIIVKKGKAYAYEKNNIHFGSFVKWFENKNSKIIDEMSVSFVN